MQSASPFSIKHAISTLHNPSTGAIFSVFPRNKPHPIHIRSVDHPVAALRGTQCSRFHWRRSGTADVSAFPRNS